MFRFAQHDASSHPEQSEGSHMYTKAGYVYIITNKLNTVLYIGVTSNLQKRIWEHKNKIVDSFSHKYNLNKLIYFETLDSIQLAIEREKFLKGKKREFKIDLINKINPSWEDLYAPLN